MSALGVVLYLPFSSGGLTRRRTQFHSFIANAFSWVNA